MGVVKQCAVLFVNGERKASPHVSALRGAGFIVEQTAGWPEDAGAVREYHVVVIRMRDLVQAPMLATRLRAKPHFGRRLLVSLVEAETTTPEQQGARASGFDIVVSEHIDGRRLAASLLRELRGRPELQCALPPLKGRSAA